MAHSNSSTVEPLSLTQHSSLILIFPQMGPRKRRPTPSLFLAEITCDEEAGRVSLAAGQSAPLSTPALEGQTQAPPSTPSLEGPAPQATLSAPHQAGRPLATVSPPSPADHAPLATLPPTYLEGQAPFPGRSGPCTLGAIGEPHPSQQTHNPCLPKSGTFMKEQDHTVEWNDQRLACPMYSLPWGKEMHYLYFTMYYNDCIL